MSCVNLFLLKKICERYQRSISSSSHHTSRRQIKTQRITPSTNLIKQIDLFLFDCDGVIWKGDSAIHGAVDILNQLQKLGKKVIFVTNNSTKSRVALQKKFESLRINVQVDDILSSSFAAAAYLSQFPIAHDKKVFVIGHGGIGEELDAFGIPHMGGQAFNDYKVVLQPGLRINHDPDVAAVVVGVDANINYYKIQYAQLCLRQNPGCRFIATNIDQVGHMTDAQEWAGGGSAVGAVQGCTGLSPIVVGKPSPFLIDYIVNKYHVDRARICMVGDNMQTDMQFGLSHGLQTVLTLSGVTSEAQMRSELNLIQPHYFVDSVADLLL